MIDAIFFQSIEAIIGITKKGRTMLRYRTTAPKKFTVYPIVNKVEKEKKMQKSIKGLMRFSLFLENNSKTKQKRSRLISIAAAMESKCFTSEG